MQSVLQIRRQDTAERYVAGSATGPNCPARPYALFLSRNGELQGQAGLQILTDDYLRCGVMKHVEGRRTIESLGWLGLLVKMI